MVQRVQEFGDELVVILPKDLAQSTGIDVGTPVELTFESGRLVIEPLADISSLSPENREFVDRIYRERTEVFKALGE